jgi:uncharacterized protein YxjI
MNFPLNIKFKLMAFVPQIYLSDKDGNEIFYIYQQYWKIKERIHIYNNREKEKELYQINADRILDFSPRLNITDESGRTVLSLKRFGWKSLLKGYWEVIIHDEVKYKIIEENPIVKFLDSLVGDIPIVGLFTGLFLNPKYKIVDNAGKDIARITKKRSFFESNFIIDNLVDSVSEEEKLIVALSGINISLFERRRG